MLRVSEWFDLILEPYLNLDELVFMKRTCSTFYQYGRLKFLIEKRIKERFGDFPKECWNKKAIFPAPIKFWKSAQYFIMWDKIYMYCVYSTEERLLQHVETNVIHEMRKRYETVIICDYCIKFCSTIGIWGETNKILKVIEKCFNDKINENQHMLDRLVKFNYREALSYIHGSFSVNRILQKQVIMLRLLDLIRHNNKHVKYYLYCTGDYDTCIVYYGFTP